MEYGWKNSQDIDQWVNDQYSDPIETKEKHPDIRKCPQNHFAYPFLLEAEKKYNARFNNDFYSFALNLSQPPDVKQKTALPKCPMVQQPKGKWPVKMFGQFLDLLDRFQDVSERQITITEADRKILGLLVFSHIFCLDKLMDKVFIDTDVYAIDHCRQCPYIHNILKNFT
jgi:hypothetical protein